MARSEKKVVQSDPALRDAREQIDVSRARSPKALLELPRLKRTRVPRLGTRACRA
jgi:hypothetical protein